jgi:hypothetical protein
MTGVKRTQNPAAARSFRFKSDTATNQLRLYSQAHRNLRGNERGASQVGGLGEVERSPSTCS